MHVYEVCVLMLNFRYCLILFIFVSFNVLGQFESNCKKVDTTDEAILKTYILPINLSDPKGDFKIRVKHGDYRILSLNGLYIMYPGLDSRHKEVLRITESRNIDGTSDSLESEEHGDLIIKITHYAKIYNGEMVKFLCVP